jgi:hypothetical protein
MAMSAVIAKLRAFQDAIVHRELQPWRPNLAIRRARLRAYPVLLAWAMTTNISADGPHGHRKGLVTATGGLRLDEPAV